MLGLNTCLNTTDTTHSACLSDTAWRQLPGISSNLKVNARRGTVGFSRLNSTIQTYQLADSDESVNIDSAQLLDAFHGLFTGRSRGTTGDDMLPDMTDLTNSILNSLMGLTGKIDMGPIVVALHFAS